MATVKKSKIVNAALRKAGISSATTLMTADPQTVADALEDLEAMVLSWKENDQLDIGYLDADTPDGSQDSGVLKSQYMAVALNLARQILIDNQRDIPDELANQAHAGKLALDAYYYKPHYLQHRNDQPMGQGNDRNAYTYNRFAIQATTEDGGGF